MTKHLNPEEMAAAVAGLDLDDGRSRHLASCVLCRTEVAELEGLLAERRNAMVSDEPDWPAMTVRVMERLPAAVPAARRQTRWLRPLLALAAAVVVAVALGVLRPDGSAPPPAEAPSVEEILAEMDALLADDDIPGFEVIDPGIEELESYIDNGAS